MNPRRIVTTLYVIFLAALGLGAGRLFLDARAQYDQRQRTQADLRRRLADAQTRLAEQEKILVRLKTDPSFVEKTLRKYNFAKPEDTVFRFPNER